MNEEGRSKITTMEQQQPENLQLIKDEPTTPPHLMSSAYGTATSVTSPNIKERLNLHVKRRLQQDAINMHSAEQQQHQQAPTTPQYLDVSTQRKEGSEKELKKQRRPYQKRTEKLNQTQVSDGGAAAAAGVQRKYKRHKMKHTQLGNVSVGSNLTQGSNSDGGLSEGGSSMPYGSAEPAAMEDEGSQDDGGLDAEGRVNSGSGRDKEKCPDVLGLVLSIKKRALMQDPEVQDFLRRLMETIKS